MAKIGNRITLADTTKALGPDGKTVAKVAEVFEESNPILQDAHVTVGNQPLGNTVTLRSSLPTVQPARINKGTKASKSGFEQVRDTIGMWDGASETPSRLMVALGQDGFARQRMLQDKGFMQALSQSVAEAIIYGDEQVNEAGMTGLEVRLRTLNPGTNRQGSIVIDAGGTGADNTSIYVVDHHEDYVSLIHPPSMTAGIEVKQKGEQRVLDADGNPMDAYVTNFLWAIGLTVLDKRHIARICNIDNSDLANAGLAGYVGPHVVFKFIDLFTQMPDEAGAQRVAYCHNNVLAAMHKLALSGANVQVTMQEYLGKFVPHIQGVPLRRLDRISIAESRVV